MIAMKTEKSIGEQSLLLLNKIVIIILVLLATPCFILSQSEYIGTPGDTNIVVFQFDTVYDITNLYAVLEIHNPTVAFALEAKFNETIIDITQIGLGKFELNFDMEMPTKLNNLSFSILHLAGNDTISMLYLKSIKINNIEIQSQEVRIINKYSAGVALYLKPPKILHVFPNPINQNFSFNVEYSVDRKDNVRIVLYDMSGREVYRGDSTPIEEVGIATREVSIDRLISDGRYVLALFTASGFSFYPIAISR